MRLDPGQDRNVQQQTSKVYAADGRLISELGIQLRTVLPLAQIPVYVRQAFVAVEDKRFYKHNGIDYWRILGALKANVLTCTTRRASRPSRCSSRATSSPSARS